MAAPESVVILIISAYLNGLLKFKLSTRMQKKGNLRDFDQGEVVVGVRQTCLNICETVDLSGFSHTTISCVYREWSEEEKISGERQLCG